MHRAICAPISVPRSQPRPPSRARSVLFHHGMDVALRGLQRGDQAKDERRHGGQSKRKPQHRAIRRRVDSQRLGPRNRREQPRNQRLERPPEEKRAANGTGEGDDRALGQQLLNEAAAVCADRQTDRDLSGSRRRAREQYVRDVGGGDQQHEPERRHDNARAPENVLPRDWERQGGCRFDDQRRRAARLLLIDATRDHRQIRPNLREFRVVAPPPDQRQPAHMRVLEKVLVRLKHACHRRGRKERRFRHVDAIESGRRDSHNRDIVAVQDDRFLEDLRIAAERASPERVTQDHDGRRAGRPTVRRREAGADGRRQASTSK